MTFTLAELLQYLTEIFFVLLVIITIVDFVRHRDKVRRDVALLLLSLTTAILLRLVRQITGIAIEDAPWMSLVGSLALLAQPYLLVRIVHYFRPVPPLVYRGALGGMLLSWALLLLLGTPLSPAVTLAMIFYFVAIDGYAVYAFVQGAFSSAGVARQRLRFAATGSAFLTLALFFIGVNVVVPELAPSTAPIVQAMAILAALAYYLSFAPPRGLRQGWQLAEMRDYLQQVQRARLKTAQGTLDSLYEAVNRAMGTDAVLIALWDDEQQALEIRKASEALAGTDLQSRAVVQDAWRQQKSGIVYRDARLGAEDAQWMQGLDAETLLMVPMSTGSRAMGLLLVFLRHGSLFIEDDLRLLTIFAQQTAILLENYAMLDTLHAQAQELERNVKERTLELQRSNEQLRQFAYVASHDLQEPLRTISTYLQLIEYRYPDKLDDEGREFINFAVEGAQRMKDLISALLQYSRVEAKQRDFGVVDSQKVLDNALRFLETAIREAEASVTHDPLPQVRADEQLLAQVFQNLISNAIKYRSSGRKLEIHIGVDQKPGQVVFCVRDNGIGIEPQYLERIFVIFQRLHHNNEYAGTGIGLAVCKKAVELLGGRIWAESEVDKGTSFYFTVPAQAPVNKQASSLYRS